MHHDARRSSLFVGDIRQALVFHRETIATVALQGAEFTRVRPDNCRSMRSTPQA
jgi:hypothetical protein